MNVSKSPLSRDLDRGDGVCKNFDDSTRLCAIYENRPLICRVDEAYEKYFYKFFSKEKYYEMNYNVCKELKNKEKRM